MTFWEKALKAAKTIGTAAANTLTNMNAHMAEEANETREIQKKLTRMNDDELFRIINNDSVFGPSSKERGIAFSILKKRGHSIEDINSSKK